MLIAKLTKSNGGIKRSFSKQSTNVPIHCDAVWAEAMIVDLVVELNIPMMAANHISKPVKALFHDSEIT